MEKVIPLKLHIEKLVKDYLKENLSLEIDSYEGAIEIKLNLGNETISSEFFYL